MRTLVTPAEITAKTQEDILEQVLEIASKYGEMVIEENDSADEFIRGYFQEQFGNADYSSRELQRFTVYGAMDGDWQRSYTVYIYENYVDAGSVDYIYTVAVVEN